MAKKKKKSNPYPRQYKPPPIGPATAAAKRRMLELYEAIRAGMERTYQRGKHKGKKYGDVRYGVRKVEVAARTAWDQFKKEFKQVGGKWVPRASASNPPKKKKKAGPKKKKKKKAPAKKKAAPKKKLADIEKAKRLYEKYSHGDKASKIVRVRMKDLPDVCVSVGELYAIEYIAKKKGRPLTRYRHVFKDQRPQLCASVDGRQLLLIGGDAKFGRRGIEG